MTSVTYNEVRIVIGSWGSYNAGNARAMGSKPITLSDYAKFASVAEKYLPMQHNKRSGFVAIIARSPADLKVEGELLHHCVGGMGYEQKFIREETLIFFIRAKDTQDTPLVRAVLVYLGLTLLGVALGSLGRERPSALVVLVVCHVANLLVEI